MSITEIKSRRKNLSTIKSWTCNEAGAEVFMPQRTACCYGSGELPK